MLYLILKFSDFTKFGTDNSVSSFPTTQMPFRVVNKSLFFFQGPFLNIYSKVYTLFHLFSSEILNMCECDLFRIFYHLVVYYFCVFVIFHLILCVFPILLTILLCFQSLLSYFKLPYYMVLFPVCFICSLDFFSED